MTKVHSKRTIHFSKLDAPYGEFSNFYPSEFEIDGVSYSTVEHYYQSCKFEDEIYRNIIINSDGPMKAKFLGVQKIGSIGDNWMINRESDRRKLGDVVALFKDTVSMREDWEDIKEDVMRRALIAKFSDENFEEVLLSTGDAEIVELSYKDRYWGRNGNGVGLNRLGGLLMEIRDGKQ